MEGVNPFEFMVGQHRYNSRFEDAVVGMNQGDTRTLNFKIALKEISDTL